MKKVCTFFKQYQSVISLFLIVKITLLIFITYGHSFIPFSTHDYQHNGYHFQQEGSTIIEKSLSPYDGQLYLQLVHSGYKGVPKKDPGLKIYAFFPLYPLLIKGLSFVNGGNLFLSGIFVSLLFSFLGLLYLYKLFSLDEEENTVQKSILYFLVFPRKKLVVRSRTG